MRKESELTVKYYSQKFNFINYRNDGIPDMDCRIQMNAPLPAKVNASTFLRINCLPIFTSPSSQLVNYNLELQLNQAHITTLAGYLKIIHIQGAFDRWW
ncbi:hypothetical protein AVEN_219320-1 [Araneus ventricosus]|uniref:Uncharacterized protein n=1 Tax=Araneus ventricosus TaxID=182803 RepID=A0A4Y2BEE1_ARAVE|nr:hypothetical protein AVEN_219320-1 [Araneus ventricosus]